jgi:virginiamycin B lyase
MSVLSLAFAFALFGTSAATSAQTFQEFALLRPGSAPSSIVAGPDHAMWFTEYRGSAIGRCTLSGEITEFLLPMPPRYPSGITVGTDGNLWFTTTASGYAAVSRITPTGELTEFPLPDPSSFPTAIVSGPDGALWFTESAGRIGRATTAGAITEFAIPGSAGVHGLTAGPDGNLWFLGLNRTIGSISPSGEVHEYPVPEMVFPLEIVAGPDGAFWFTDYGAGKIFRFSLAGEISSVPLSTPNGITIGPDNTFWITELGYHVFEPISLPTIPARIANVTASGSVREFPVPDPLSEPAGIATADDGSVWFVQSAANSIVRFTGAPRPARHPRHVRFR